MEGLNRAPLVIVGLVVVTIASLWFALRKPRIETSLYSGSIQQSLGQAACDEAAKVLGDAGGKILLIMENKGEDKLDACFGYRKGFQEGLKRHRTLQVVGIEIPPWPKEDTENDNHGLRLAFYQRLQSQHPEANCFVSFVQAPFLSAEEMTQWDPAKMPKLITTYKPQPGHPWRDLVR